MPGLDYSWREAEEISVLVAFDFYLTDIEPELPEPLGTRSYSPNLIGRDTFGSG